jgi:hypothetical protein
LSLRFGGCEFAFPQHRHHLGDSVPNVPELMWFFQASGCLLHPQRKEFALRG